MRSIAHFMVNPLVPVILIAAVGYLFYRLGKKTPYRLSLAAIALWFFIVVVSPLALVLVEKKEYLYPSFTQFEEFSSRSEPVRIVVPGAGFTPDPRIPVTDQIGTPVLERLVEAIRIYRKLPNAEIVTSGAYSRSDTISQGEAVALAALELGVSPSDTAFLPGTINTEMEAKKYARRFGSDRKVILVTHALHMERAAFWFKAYGIDLVPAPTGHIVKYDPDHRDSRWIPSFSKIDMLKRYQKEVAGTWYARWKTRNKTTIMP